MHDVKPSKDFLNQRDYLNIFLADLFNLTLNICEIYRFLGKFSNIKETGFLEYKYRMDTWFVSRKNKIFITRRVKSFLNLIYTNGFYVCIFYLLVVKLGY